MIKVEIPAPIRDLSLIASVSGGKDSTAVMLLMRENDIECRHVFADTHWEADETYRYLDYLRKRLDVTIDVVASEGMLARAETRAGFPRRRGKWCTRELKIQPIRAYHYAVGEEDERETAAIVGVRAQESAKRANLPELGAEADGPFGFGWPVWRPIIDWGIEDVLEIHKRHGVEVNPLYQRGHNRVGCWPCIYSNKEEIRLIADNDPERIQLISEYEGRFGKLRAQRNVDTPGRYKYESCTFFEGRQGSPLGDVPKIADVVEWSRTTHGGRQFSLFDEAPRGGCYRWGLCEPAETPDRDDDEGSDEEEEAL